MSVRPGTQIPVGHDEPLFLGVRESKVFRCNRSRQRQSWTTAKFPKDLQHRSVTQNCFFFPPKKEKSVHRYLVTSPPKIELGLALFWTVMNRNFLPLPYFHIAEKWLVVVRRFCQFFILSNVKVYIHKTYTCTISICIIESIRRSTQGSSVRIDRFVFGSTINSQKLDEKVKN